MDGNRKKPRGVNKAARPATAALETPLAISDDDGATAAQVLDVVVGQPDVASVDESHGATTVGAGTDEEEDEQVERFYALLANIRAMRGLPLALRNMVASSSSTTSGSGDTDIGTAARKKRPRRSAEPPWRPAFRMEDFEEPPPPPPAAPSSCKLRKQRTTTSGADHDDRGHGHGESSGGPRPPVAVVASSSSMPRFQQSDSRSCSRD